MPPRKPPAQGASASASDPDPEPEPQIKPDPEPLQSSTEQATAGAAPTPAGHISIASTPAADSPTTSAAASPAPSASQPAAPGRSGSLSRPSGAARGRGGKPIIAKPKFAGRRSQASRAEAEKAETERKKAELEARAKEAAAKARREGRGRGRGDGRLHRGRGRGGYMGESERQSTVSSGPFSGGMINHGDTERRRAPRGGGGGGWNGASGSGGGGGGGGGRSSSGVKMEPGGGEVEMLPPIVKAEDGGYISSDEDEVDTGPGRVNIDELGVIDLTADSEADPTRKFIPVRLKREEHKERTLGVSANADGATAKTGEKPADSEGGPSEKRKGKQKAKAKDVEITGQSEKFHGAYSSSSEEEPVIKAEPTDEDAVPEPHIQEPPSSPESRRKTKEKIKASALEGMTTAPERPAYQTQEEIDEWERQQEDLRILYSELSLPPTTDADGDANMTSAEQAADKKQDKVYLFQFPPVLPALIPVPVKPDPEAAPQTGDSMDVDENPSTQNSTAQPQQQEGKDQQPFPPGAVGQLRIHRSGRATLDWGGTRLSVGMGTEASFLQDVLVADLPEGKGGEGGDEAEGGVAMAMGQVKGKFVVVPDWEGILG